ncbi:Acylphosphatase-2 [Blattella germanica]|nr:Acylphosphatase-2 [Blattella germanica]
MSSPLKSVNFEVFGKVQGVFFRKYTDLEAKRLGLRGWCMNTDKGTVTGTMEGPERKVEEMKKWLVSVGSPKSRIERAEFKNEKNVEKYSFQEFRIKR